MEPPAAAAAPAQWWGAMALFGEAGRLCGTLGGGVVAAGSERRAAQALVTGRGEVLDFRLDNASAAEAGAICGGAMRVLIDSSLAGDPTPFAQAVCAAEARERGLLSIRLTEADGWLAEARWLPAGQVAALTDFPGRQAADECLARETPRLFERDTDARRELVYFAPVTPRPRLLIAGGGHLGQAVAAQAQEVGFEAHVFDDRPEFTRSDLFPDGVTTHCGPVPETLAAQPLTEDTYVVLVTRGHQHDAEALAVCLGAPLAYVGMIGSRRKVALLKRHFLDTGRAAEAELERVFAPVGLDLGAVTVPEIATSIVAQLISVRRKGRDHEPGHLTQS